MTDLVRVYTASTLEPDVSPPAYLERSAQGVLELLARMIREDGHTVPELPAATDVEWTPADDAMPGSFLALRLVVEVPL